MLILDLFSGSQSVKKVCDVLGWDYISVDLNNKYEPTYNVDILKWNYQAEDLKPDLIWASPCCTTWSIATHKHRTLKEGLEPKTEAARNANLLIAKTIEIINYYLDLNPKMFYLIENPRGRLQHYQPMIDFAKYKTLVYYINYGHQNAKPTNIWSNVELWTEKQERKQMIKWQNIRGFEARNSIPAKLIYKLITHCFATLF